MITLTTPAAKTTTIDLNQLQAAAPRGHELNAYLTSRRRRFKDKTKYDRKRDKRVRD